MRATSNIDTKLQMLQPVQTSTQAAERSSDFPIQNNDYLQDDIFIQAQSGISDPILYNKLLSVLNELESEDPDATNYCNTCKKFIKQGISYLNTPKEIAEVTAFLNDVLIPENSEYLGLTQEQINYLKCCTETCKSCSRSTMIETAQSFRTQQEAELGISPQEKFFRNQTYKVNPSHPEIENIINSLFDNGPLNHEMSVEDISASILAYVQNNFEYTEDTGQDYWQTIDETLNLGGGDCEDLSILTGALLMNSLSSLGYSQAEIRNMVQLSAGYMNTGLAFETGHMVVKITSLPGKTLVLDSTGSTGPIADEDFPMDEVFSFNDQNFIVHQTIREDFETALHLQFKLTPNGTGDYSDQIDLERLLPRAERSIATRIEITIEKLQEIVSRPIDIPKLYQGNMYRKYIEGSSATNLQPENALADGSGYEWRNGIMQSVSLAGGDIHNGYVVIPATSDVDISYGGTRKLLVRDGTSYRAASQAEIDAGTGLFRKITVYKKVNAPDTSPALGTDANFDFFRVRKYEKQLGAATIRFHAVELKADFTVLPGSPGYEEANPFLNYIYESRDLMNKFQLLLNVGMAVAEQITMAAQAIEDQAMSDQDKQNTSAYRQHTGKMRSKLLSTLTKWNSKTNDGITNITQMMFSFVNSSNQAEFARGRMAIDMWPREADTQSSQDGASIAKDVALGIFGGLVDEWTGILEYQRAETRLEISKFQAGIDLSNTRAMSTITFDSIGRIELWDPSRWSNPAEMEAEIRDEANRASFFYFGDQTWRANTPGESLTGHTTRESLQNFLMSIGPRSGLGELARFDDYINTAGNHRNGDPNTDYIYTSLAEATQSRTTENNTDYLFNLADSTYTPPPTSAPTNVSGSTLTDAEQREVYQQKLIRQQAEADLALASPPPDAQDRYDAAQARIEEIYGIQEERDKLTELQAQLAAETDADFRVTIQQSIDNQQAKVDAMEDEIAEDPVDPATQAQNQANQAGASQTAQDASQGGPPPDIDITDDRQLTEIQLPNAYTGNLMITYNNPGGSPPVTDQVLVEGTDYTVSHEPRTQPTITFLIPRVAGDTVRIEARTQMLSEYKRTQAQIQDENGLINVPRQNIGGSVIKDVVVRDGSGNETSIPYTITDERGGYITVDPANVPTGSEVVVYYETGDPATPLNPVNTSGRKLFLDYNFPRQHIHRRSLIRYQTYMRTTMMIKNMINNAKLKAAEQVGGGKASAASGNIQNLADASLSGDLGTQSSLFEGTMSSTTQLLSTINGLQSSRIQMYKADQKMALKLTKLAVTLAIEIVAEIAGAALGSIPIVGQILTKQYWTYAINTTGTAAAELGFLGWEMAIEQNTNEWHSPSTLQQANFSHEFNQVNTQAAINQRRVDSQEAAAEILQNRDANGAFRSIFSEAQSDFYSNRLEQLTLEARGLFTGVYKNKEFYNNSEKYNRDVPIFIEDRGDGYFVQDHYEMFLREGAGNINGSALVGIETDVLGNETTKTRDLRYDFKTTKSGYLNRIKMHLSILAAIYDAVETMAAMIAGTAKASTTNKFSGAIQAYIGYEQTVIQSLKDEVNTFLAAQKNNANKAKRIRILRDDLITTGIKALIQSTASFIPVFPLGPTINMTSMVLFDAADLLRKHIFGPYASLAANYRNPEHQSPSRGLVNLLSLIPGAGSIAEEYPLLPEGPLDEFDPHLGQQTRGFSNLRQLDPTDDVGDTIYRVLNQGNEIAVAPTQPFEFRDTATLDSIADYIDGSTQTMGYGSIFNKNGVRADFNERGQKERLLSHAGWYRLEAKERGVIKNLYNKLSEMDYHPVQNMPQVSVNPQDMIDAQEELNHIFTTRTVMILIMQAIHNAKKNALKAIVGFKGQSDILGQTQGIIDTYNDSQLEASQQLGREFASRSEAYNVYKEGQNNVSIDGTSLFIRNLLFHFANPGNPKNPQAGGGEKYNKMYKRLQAINKARGLLQALANVTTGLVGVLSKPNFANGARNAFEVSEEDKVAIEKEIKKKKDKKSSLESKEANGTITPQEKKELNKLNGEIGVLEQEKMNLEKKIENQSNTENYGLNDGALNIVAGGNVAVNPSIRASANSKITRKFRQQQVKSDIRTAISEALIDAAGELSEQDGTKLSGKLAKILKNTEKTKKNAVGFLFEAAQAIADVKNFATQKLLSGAVTLGTQAIGTAIQKIIKRIASKKQKKANKTKQQKGDQKKKDAIFEKLGKLQKEKDGLKQGGALSGKLTPAQANKRRRQNQKELKKVLGDKNKLSERMEKRSKELKKLDKQFEERSKQKEKVREDKFIKDLENDGFKPKELGILSPEGKVDRNKLMEKLQDKKDIKSQKLLKKTKKGEVTEQKKLADKKKSRPEQVAKFINNFTEIIVSQIAEQAIIATQASRGASGFQSPTFTADGKTADAVDPGTADDDGGDGNSVIDLSSGFSDNEAFGVGENFTGTAELENAILASQISVGVSQYLSQAAKAQEKMLQYVVKLLDKKLNLTKGEYTHNPLKKRVTGALGEDDDSIGERQKKGEAKFQLDAKKEGIDWDKLSPHEKKQFVLKKKRGLRAFLAVTGGIGKVGLGLGTIASIGGGQKAVGGLGISATHKNAVQEQEEGLKIRPDDPRFLSNAYARDFAGRDAALVDAIRARELKRSVQDENYSKRRVDTLTGIDITRQSFGVASLAKELKEEGSDSEEDKELEKTLTAETNRLDRIASKGEFDTKEINAIGSLKTTAVEKGLSAHNTADGSPSSAKQFADNIEDIIKNKLAKKGYVSVGNKKTKFKDKFFKRTDDLDTEEFDPQKQKRLDELSSKIKKGRLSDNEKTELATLQVNNPQALTNGEELQLKDLLEKKENNDPNRHTQDDLTIAQLQKQKTDYERLKDLEDRPKQIEIGEYHKLLEEKQKAQNSDPLGDTIRETFFPQGTQSTEYKNENGENLTPEEITKIAKNLILEFAGSREALTNTDTSTSERVAQKIERLANKLEKTEKDVIEQEGKLLDIPQKDGNLHQALLDIEGGNTLARTLEPSDQLVELRERQKEEDFSDEDKLLLSELELQYETGVGLTARAITEESRKGKIPFFFKKEFTLPDGNTKDEVLQIFVDPKEGQTREQVKEKLVAIEEEKARQKSIESNTEVEADKIEIIDNAKNLTQFAYGRIDNLEADKLDPYLNTLKTRDDGISSATKTVNSISGLTKVLEKTASSDAKQRGLKKAEETFNNARTAVEVEDALSNPEVAHSLRTLLVARGKDPNSDDTKKQAFETYKELIEELKESSLLDKTEANERELDKLDAEARREDLRTILRKEEHKEFLQKLIEVISKSNPTLRDELDNVLEQFEDDGAVKLPKDVETLAVHLFETLLLLKHQRDPALSIQHEYDVPLANGRTKKVQRAGLSSDEYDRQFGALRKSGEIIDKLKKDPRHKSRPELSKLDSIQSFDKIEKAAAETAEKEFNLQVGRFENSDSTSLKEARKEVFGKLGFFGASKLGFKFYLGSRQDRERLKVLERREKRGENTKEAVEKFKELSNQGNKSIERRGRSLVDSILIAERNNGAKDRNIGFTKAVITGASAATNTLTDIINNGNEDSEKEAADVLLTGLKELHKTDKDQIGGKAEQFLNNTIRLLARDASGQGTLQSLLPALLQQAQKESPEIQQIVSNAILGAQSTNRTDQLVNGHKQENSIRRGFDVASFFSLGGYEPEPTEYDTLTSQLEDLSVKVGVKNPSSDFSSTAENTFLNKTNLSKFSTEKQLQDRVRETLKDNLPLDILLNASDEKLRSSGIAKSLLSDDKSLNDLIERAEHNPKAKITLFRLLKAEPSLLKKINNRIDGFTTPLPNQEHLKEEKVLKNIRDAINSNKTLAQYKLETLASLSQEQAEKKAIYEPSPVFSEGNNPVDIRNNDAIAAAKAKITGENTPNLIASLNTHRVETTKDILSFIEKADATNNQEALVETLDDLAQTKLDSEKLADIFEQVDINNILPDDGADPTDTRGEISAAIKLLETKSEEARQNNERPSFRHTIQETKEGLEQLREGLEIKFNGATSQEEQDTLNGLAQNLKDFKEAFVHTKSHIIDTKEKLDTLFEEISPELIRLKVSSQSNAINEAIKKEKLRFEGSIAEGKAIRDSQDNGPLTKTERETRVREQLREDSLKVEDVDQARRFTDIQNLAQSIADQTSDSDIKTIFDQLENADEDEQEKIIETLAEAIVIAAAAGDQRTEKQRNAAHTEILKKLAPYLSKDENQKLRIQFSKHVVSKLDTVNKSLGYNLQISLHQLEEGYRQVKGNQTDPLLSTLDNGHHTQLLAASIQELQNGLNGKTQYEQALQKISADGNSITDTYRSLVSDPDHQESAASLLAQHTAVTTPGGAASSFPSNQLVRDISLEIGASPDNMEILGFHNYLRLVEAQSKELKELITDNNKLVAEKTRLQQKITDGKTLTVFEKTKFNILNSLGALETGPTSPVAEAFKNLEEVAQIEAEKLQNTLIEKGIKTNHINSSLSSTTQRTFFNAFTRPSTDPPLAENELTGLANDALSKELKVFKQRQGPELSPELQDKLETAIKQSDQIEIDRLTDSAFDQLNPTEKWLEKVEATLNGLENAEKVKDQNKIMNELDQLQFLEAEYKIGLKNKDIEPQEGVENLISLTQLKYKESQRKQLNRLDTNGIKNKAAREIGDSINNLSLKLSVPNNTLDENDLKVLQKQVDSYLAQKKEAHEQPDYEVLAYANAFSNKGAKNAVFTTTFKNSSPYEQELLFQTPEGEELFLNELESTKPDLTLLTHLTAPELLRVVKPEIRKQILDFLDRAENTDLPFEKVTTIFENYQEAMKSLIANPRHQDTLPALHELIEIETSGEKHGLITPDEEDERLTKTEKETIEELAKLFDQHAVDRVEPIQVFDDARALFNDLRQNAPQERQTQINDIEASINKRIRQHHASQPEATFIKDLIETKGRQGEVGLIHNLFNGNQAIANNLLQNNLQVEKLRTHHPETYTNLLLAIKSGGINIPNANETFTHDLNMLQNNEQHITAFQMADLKNPGSYAGFIDDFYTMPDPQQRARLFQAAATANPEKIEKLLSIPRVIGPGQTDNRLSILKTTKLALSNVSSSSHSQTAQSTLTNIENNISNLSLDKLGKLATISKRILDGSKNNRPNIVENNTRELTHTLRDLESLLDKLVIRDNDGNILSKPEIEKLLDPKQPSTVQLMNSTKLLRGIQKSGGLNQQETMAVMRTLENLRKATMNELLKPKGQELAIKNKNQTEKFLEIALHHDQTPRELRSLYQGKTKNDTYETIKKVIQLTQNFTVKDPENAASPAQKADAIFLEKTQYLNGSDATNRKADYILIKDKLGTIHEAPIVLQTLVPNLNQRGAVYDGIIKEALAPTNRNKINSLPLIATLLDNEDPNVLEQIPFIAHPTVINDPETPHFIALLRESVTNPLIKQKLSQLTGAIGGLTLSPDDPNFSIQAKAPNNTSQLYEIHNWVKQEELHTDGSKTPRKIDDIRDFLLRDNTDPQVRAEVISNLGTDPQTLKLLNKKPSIFTGQKGTALARSISNGIQTGKIILDSQQIKGLMRSKDFKDIFTSNPHITGTTQAINPMLTGDMLYDFTLQQIEHGKALPQMNARQFNETVKVAIKNNTLSNLQPLLHRNLDKAKALIINGVNTQLTPDVTGREPTDTEIASKIVTALSGDGTGQQLLLNYLDDILANHTGLGFNVNSELNNFLQTVYSNNSFFSETDQTTQRALFEAINDRLDNTANRVAQNDITTYKTNFTGGQSIERIPTDNVEKLSLNHVKGIHSSSTLTQKTLREGNDNASTFLRGKSSVKKTILANLETRSKVAEENFASADSNEKKQLARLELNKLRDERTAFFLGLANHKEKIPTEYLGDLKGLTSHAQSTQELQAIKKLNKKVTDYVQNDSPSFKHSLQALKYLQGEVIQPKITSELLAVQPNFATGDFTSISTQDAEKVIEMLQTENKLNPDGTLKDPHTFLRPNTPIQSDSLTKDPDENNDINKLLKIYGFSDNAQRKKIISKLKASSSLTPSTAHKELVQSTMHRHLSQRIQGFKVSKALSEIDKSDLTTAQKEELFKLMIETDSGEKELDVLVYLTKQAANKKQSVDFVADLLANSIASHPERYQTPKYKEALQEIIGIDALTKAGILYPTLQELDRIGKGGAIVIQRNAPDALKKAMKQPFRKLSPEPGVKATLRKGGEHAARALHVHASAQLDRYFETQDYLSSILQKASKAGDQTTSSIMLDIQSRLRGKETRTISMTDLSAEHRTRGKIAATLRDRFTAFPRETGLDTFHDTSLHTTTLSPLVNISEKKFRKEFSLPEKLFSNEDVEKIKIALLASNFLTRTSDGSLSITSKQFPSSENIDWKNILPNVSPNQHSLLENHISQRLNAPRVFV